MKKMLAIASSALVLAAGAAGVLHARAIEAVHSYVYYSDASQTEVVGLSIEMCLQGGVVPGRVSGTQTAYVSSSVIYYCDTATGSILP
ncbi:hypothetical protein ACFELO_02780 [Oceanicaulis sp. LC35]|uniref:hypothetical protein n=1 Tax=Oceanicaulis sp. LC35 TaxID=3349635 RepID=UPI003F8756F7